MNQIARSPVPGDPRTKPSSGGLSRLIDILVGRVATLLLAALALTLGIGSFAYLAGGIKLGVHSGAAVGLAVGDIAILLLLIIVLVARVTRVVLEARRGAAGARLHVRLVLLFGGIAAVPAILVAIFAAVFFNFGIQAWFNQRVRTALAESQQVAVGYMDAKKNSIRVDALAIANDLNQNGPIFYGSAQDFFDQGFLNVLIAQTALHGLTQAVIFEPLTDKVIASAGLFAGTDVSLPPQAQIDLAEKHQIVVWSTPHSTLEHAMVQLEAAPALMLMVERPIDPSIYAHVKRTEKALAEYNRLEHQRGQFELFFALIFVTVALLVLSGAALIGLVFANQIARPIGHLIRAAERVRSGDLQVRVPEGDSGDDVAGLSRAFNRMTGQLAAQRAELMSAYGQIDERRRFTETVLAGVSAGVIGLDPQGRIELPNKAASDLLGIDLLAHLGERLSVLLPDFAASLALAEATPDRPITAEIAYAGQGGKRIFMARIGADRHGDRAPGFVVTFDDITALQTAQRKAAWADVARRIAHEIKNPLTPIQLSAERMKRRFAKEIKSDPESFAQCADTIVRHVGDIGRMVDEFSAFARMPVPVMRLESLSKILREAVILQRTAHAEIDWRVELPPDDPRALCDARLIGQALTNLLQNAADSIAMRPISAEQSPHGEVVLRITEDAAWYRIEVIDNGIGLPEQDRDRLTEPYVTHKVKGTGLGLAIVRKIMEDHHGALELASREDGVGAVVTLLLPSKALVNDAVSAGLERND
ncbi:two-component system, NtrC family, nitrogen regulation sensor histidine kinase NtrY [Acidiphilium sp. MT5]|jgi:two-component system nitrogen regulation sensor histidine kinase NtrY